MARVPAVALLVVLLAPALVLAQTQPNARVELRGAGEEEALAEVDPGQLVTVWAEFTIPPRPNATFEVYLNGSIDDKPWNPARNAFDEPGKHNVTRVANVPDDAENAVLVSYVLLVRSKDTSDENASWEQVSRVEDSFSVDVFAPEAPPGPPLGPIVGVVALVVLAGVAVGVYAKRRRPRQIKAEAPRSRALQELEREDKAARGKRVETAEPAAPALHPQLKILEARAADVRRIIELAQERKTRGELTEHQLKMIREKKEAELQRIEEEMAQYRGG